MVAHTCPGSFNCSAREGRTSFDIGPVPTYVSIFSSSLSCLGSLLIFVAYYMLPKKLRTGIPTIITLLAIADLVTAIGYLFAAGNFLSHFNVRDASKCDTFQILCEIQSFVTTWSSLCSYAWTNILAVHFYLKIVQHQTQCRDAKLIPIYNIVAWGGPLLIMVPLLATGKLGFSPYVASNWCYVADTNYGHTTLKQDVVVIVVLLVAGELWVLVTYLVAAGLYILTSTHLRVQVCCLLSRPLPPYGHHIHKVQPVQHNVLYRLNFFSCTCYLTIYLAISAYACMQVALQVPLSNQCSCMRKL